MALLLQKKFYFVRHGQTDWNVEKICQGHTDILLNETGREEAKRLGHFLKDFPFSAIFSSPLKRALETAELIQTFLPHLPLHILDELKERCWGILEGGPSLETFLLEEKEKKEPGQLAKLGIESMENVKMRMGQAVEYALMHCDNPLIISHGRALRGLCELLDVPTFEQLPNAALVECIPSASKWNIIFHNY